jgi:DNA-binding PadR family transcriptional regulator
MPDRPRDVSPLLPLKSRYLEILLSLVEGPRHGYGLMQDVRVRTEGRVRLWPAALYGSLRELQELALIEETGARPASDEDDERRRYYRLTPKGRRALEAEVQRLENVVRAARSAGVARLKKA